MFAHGVYCHVILRINSHYFPNSINRLVLLKRRQGLLCEIKMNFQFSAGLTLEILHSSRQSVFLCFVQFLKHMAIRI
jgi:hypothetical protein